MEALATVRPEVLAGRVRSVLAVNAMKELMECNVPVLYLRGAKDVVVPRHNVAEIRKCVPTARIVEFDTRHWVLQTEPAAAGKVIGEFVAGVERV